MRQVHGIPIAKIFSINFAPTHITTEGEDYTSTTSSDTFDDTDPSECVTIPIISDSLDEEEECFGVSLSASSYPGLTLSPDIGTICINDEDGKNHALLKERLVLYIL